MIAGRIALLKASTGQAQLRSPGSEERFRLDGGARNLLDWNAGTTRFLCDGVVLLLDGFPSRFIAVEPTQKGARDTPVRAAGAILVENVEEDIAALNGL
jgi:hypothetical protein